MVKTIFPPTEVKTADFKTDIHRMLDSDAEEVLVVIWQPKKVPTMGLGIGISAQNFEGNKELVEQLQLTFYSWLKKQSEQNK